MSKLGKIQTKCASCSPIKFTVLTHGPLYRISKHLHLNYAFGLYQDVLIDSLHAGNETRFLNHAPRFDEEPIGRGTGAKKGANVNADNLIVHGIPYIVLRTSK